MSDCIVFLSYLNYVFIFIQTMHFEVFEFYLNHIFWSAWIMYEKKNYDFTIRVYIVFFVSCQKYVFDNLDYYILCHNYSLHVGAHVSCVFEWSIKSIRIKN